ncbi:MAG: tail fiber protein [Prevotellaceae bacterium]|jgi:microcystin-dependent protein|nr:tail fiber protein [Prevotellaceae bacterium]
MKTLRFLTILATLAFSYDLPAQVGINTTNPDSTAALHIFHNSKGVLLPVVNAATRQEIVSGNAEVGDGLLVYDTLQKLYYFRNSTDGKWIVLNPWRVSESTATPWGDVRLGEEYKQRNVYIGDNNAATAEAKLHVGGTLMVGDAVIAKNGIAVTGTATVSSTFTVGFGPTTTTISDNKITSGTVTATNFIGYGTIPLGGIIMWSGTIPPDGWVLCDGQVSSATGYKTPDLRGKFIVGYHSADNDYNVPGDFSTQGTAEGKTGGAKEVILTGEQMPKHTHFNDSPLGDDDGHSGKYAAHTSNNISRNGLTYDNEGGESYVGHTGYSGNNQPHENRPPYYTLAFIMRVK